MEQLWTERRSNTERENGFQPLLNTGDPKSATAESTACVPSIAIDWELESTPTSIVGDGSLAQTKQDGVQDNQRAIKCMEDFNRYAKRALEKEAGSKPVTIALIDDGVDLDDGGVNEMVTDGRSYFQRQGKPIVEPFWTSSNGHGAAMAGIIRTVCPMAKLFVVRLNEYNSDNGKSQIHAGSAARVRLSPILFF